MIIYQNRLLSAVLICLLSLGLLESNPIIAEGSEWDSLPMLRGAHIGNGLAEEDLRVLGVEWNANVVGVRILKDYPPLPSFPDDFDEWFETEMLPELDFVINMCMKYRMYVIIAFFSPVEHWVLKRDKAARDRLIDLWRRIACRYKDSEIVIGYDLLNEPRLGPVWETFANRIVSAIREIDTQTSIIIEPFGGAPQYFADLNPIEDKYENIVYSVHMYEPHEFTFQGLGSDWPHGVEYPGEINGEFWDKERLDFAMRDVVEFQERVNTPIFVGEFSVIYDAPEGTAYQYLKDVIELFEEKRWHWTYHAYREWWGWSMEEPERKSLLESYLSKNEKPVFTSAGITLPSDIQLYLIGDKSVVEGETLTFTIFASNPDGDTLIYFASDLPQGASFDLDTRTFTWTPTSEQAGIYNVHFEVSDGKLTDSEDITITVTESDPYLGVAYWKFDEGSGTIAEDSSGCANNAIIYGATWVQGKKGSALEFDGVDDYIDCANVNDETLNLTDEVTMIAWIKPHILSGGHHIVDKFYDNYAITIIGTGFRVIYRNEAGSWNAVDAYDVISSTVRWYHVVGVIDSSSNVSLYVDGSLVKTAEFIGHSINPTTSSQSLFIGTRGGTASFFNGTIDEVRIYNRALSANGVLELYNAGLTSTFLYGDVSQNGEISAYDASLAAQYAVGLISLTSEQIQAADVTGNGAVSATDAAWTVEFWQPEPVLPGQVVTLQLDINVSGPAPTSLLWHRIPFLSR